MDVLAMSRLVVLMAALIYRPILTIVVLVAIVASPVRLAVEGTALVLLVRCHLLLLVK
jgi:hypothetical protein